MSPKKGILFFLLAFLLFLQTSCVNLKQPNLSIKYYTLEYQPPAFQVKDQLACIIKVDNFSVAPNYDTTRIIYSNHPFDRESYIYYKWSVNPGEMVTYLIGRDMRQSGLFKGVLLPGEMSTGISYRLGGMLDEFYEQDEPNARYAVLSLTVNVRTANDEQKGESLIFQKSYTMKEIFKKKNPDALAGALSRAMEKVSHRIIDDIYSRVKDKGGFYNK